MTMYPQRDSGEPARIVRLPDEGWIAGICTGFGRTLGLDPSVLRVVLAFGLLSLTTWTILAYLLAWAIVPSAQDQ